MPQLQTSTFEACSWVPILQVGLGKVGVNSFPKAITTWHGGETNPRPPDLESDALTTPPRCPIKEAHRNKCMLKVNDKKRFVLFSFYIAPDTLLLEEFYIGSPTDRW
ncbi:hypothetical protein ElyMa_000932800 [Elysia marginata]|uniref:PiggyBac transposable element-derived protein domain-containing protein n=1 Tax=Elysia marginata TaxID=1093978 RepID=A0AAV4HD56_9GAST|nr:hypothetical protein ElyMa_000932800 [Elysia marginata]